MNHFAIYSPVLGVQKKVPHIFLSKAYTPDCSNVQLWDGEVRTAKMRCVEMQTSGLTTAYTPDGNDILKYYTILSASGDKYTTAFTKNHIYYWKTSTSEWSELWAASGTTCTNWSVAEINGSLIATNNVDVPLKWESGVDSEFIDYTPAVASGVTVNRAKSVITFENHIIFGNYSLTDGNSYYNGLAWSALDTQTADTVYTAFPTFIADGLTDAGSGFVQGPGFVQGMGIKEDYLYVFKDDCIRAYWYTGTSLIFYSKNISEKLGCTAIDSIVNDAAGNLYYYASDLTFREITIGTISDPIDNLSRAINQNLLYLIRSTFIAEYGEVWWAVPYNGNSTANDKIYVFKNGIWTIRESGTTAFGQWERTTSLDWADLGIYSGWDEWAWDEWLAPEASIGFPIDLCSYTSGVTCQVHGSYVDMGVAYTSYFTMETDLGDGALLRQYKRLLNVLVYIYSMGTGTLNLYFKRDNEADWQSAGSISLDYSSEIVIPELPVDYRAKTFKIKIESDVPFRFLGMEFDYILSGLR